MDELLDFVGRDIFAGPRLLPSKPQRCGLAVGAIVVVLEAFGGARPVLGLENAEEGHGGLRVASGGCDGLHSLQTRIGGTQSYAADAVEWERAERRVDAGTRQRGAARLAAEAAAAAAASECSFWRRGSQCSRVLDEGGE